MRTLSISCGGIVGIFCSLAALGRYWLIMTFGLGFSEVGDERLAFGANAALLAGTVGLLLSVGMMVGYPFFVRRGANSRRGLSANPTALPST